MKMNCHRYMITLLYTMLTVVSTNGLKISAQVPAADPGLPSHILGTSPPGAEGGGSSVKAWDLGKITGHVNVKSYGAIGDGLADDSDAIQAALNDDTVDKLYFPAGTYRLTKALIIRRGGMHILGESRLKTIIKQEGNDQNGFELDAGQQHLCFFERMRVTGPGHETSTAAGFYMQSKTANSFTSRHRWTDVEVSGFHKGWHAYWIPLVTWTNCQANDCRIAWYLDRCDTPLLINCGSHAYAARTTDVCVRAVNGGFSGHIINGEWGHSKRVFDFQKGNWTVTGGNIETNTDDGVIFVCQSARLDIRKLRISLPAPSIANSAVIVMDAQGGFPAQLTVGDMTWDTAGWRNVVVRGIRYFQARPVFVGHERNTQVFYESSLGGLTYFSGYASAFTTWPLQEWLYSIPNTEASNEQRRGTLAMFSVNDNTLSRFEHPIAFVRTRWGTHQRSSLLNDRLMDVLYSKEQATSNTGGVETNLVSESVLGYTHNQDGDLVTLRATGTMAANANPKTLRVYFGGKKVFDSAAQTWSGKAYNIETRISRRIYNQWVASTTLIVDGELPMVRIFKGDTTLNGPNVLRLTARGIDSNDIVSEYADVVWRKSQHDD